MLQRLSRLAALMLLGLIVTVGTLIATDQRVQGQAGNDPNEQHFWCYIVSQQTPQAAVTVTLRDQFQTATVSVGEPLQFCTPTVKIHGTQTFPITDENAHLTLYPAAAALPSPRTLIAANQFGAQQRFTVDRAQFLLVPTQKLTPPYDEPRRLNHFWCYPVAGPSVREPVSLDDPFSTTAVDFRVDRPRLFCNPVAKTGVPDPAAIENEEAHLVCYEIRGPRRTQARMVRVLNQFERDTFTLTAYELLCVPSTKTLPAA